jgi:hypothetical protein
MKNPSTETLFMESRNRRAEERKFKRIPLRFGPTTPEYRASGIQISSRGLFISTTRPIYPPGSVLIIEIPTSNGSYTSQAIVRHAKVALGLLVNNDRSGMGVEFLSPPEEFLDYIASL